MGQLTRLLYLRVLTEALEPFFLVLACPPRMFSCSLTRLSEPDSFSYMSGVGKRLESHHPEQGIALVGDAVLLLSGAVPTVLAIHGVCGSKNWSKSTVQEAWLQGMWWLSFLSLAAGCPLVALASGSFHPIPFW